MLSWHLGGEFFSLGNFRGYLGGIVPERKICHVEEGGPGCLCPDPHA